MVTAIQAAKIKSQFTVICAWCDQVLNDKPLTLNLPQTHTICKKCLVKMRQEMAEVQLEKEIVFS
jgi:hypothetical protein